MSVLFGLTMLYSLSACITNFQERSIFNERGIRIGIQHDPSTDRSSPPSFNSHPVQLTAADIRDLLSMVQVSGYTGTLAGLLVNPQAIPLFKQEELDLISKPLAAALGQAGPKERVYFSLPNLSVPYERDRTAGALFVREPYLFIWLKDHSAYTRTDTGGGDDEHDPQNTKALKLSTVSPAREAVLPPDREPEWGPFERVHLAMNVRQALAAASTPPAAPVSALVPAAQTPKRAQSLQQDKSGTQASGVASDDLQLQIRELTNSNLDLRSRLKDQAGEMDDLKAELRRLRQELQELNGKAKSNRPTPSRKPSQ